MKHGNVKEKERDLLATLQWKLGLKPTGCAFECSCTTVST